MTFTGTLGVRVGLLDFANYELVKIGLYRVQISCWLDTGVHGKPVSLQAAPLSTTAVANGVCCGASPYPSLVAEVDDQDHFSLSRSLHVRYTDERHQLQEATVFHLQGVPMLPAEDSRLFLRLRLLHAELPQDGVELASTHFAPVSSRTLCLSAVAAGAGQSFFSPMLFDRDHLACVGVTVHAGLVGSAFVPPALPPALTLRELAASAEELRAALPARGAADGPSQPQPQPRPPAWARKYFRHAAAQLSLLEAISPAAHRAGQLAREAAVSALLAHATAAALGSAAAPSESAALSQAAGHFNAGLLAACSASAALEAQLEGVGQGAGSGQAPGGHFEAQAEPLAAAQRALVEAVQAVEGRVREWCQLPPESALPAAAGAGAGAALALAEVALDASGLHSKAQRQQQQQQQQQQQPSAAQAATHLAEQAAQASHSLGRAWKAACQALLAAPGARFLPPLQQGFQAAAAAALAACCSRQQAPLAGLTQPLAAELQHPARRSAAGSAAAAAALAHEPAVDTARHYIHASWEHYSQLPPPLPPAAAAAAPSGHHLVVFVHGLGGNVHDMRGYKAALKAHHPSLLCYTASSLAGSSGGDILANGLRLAQEIAGLCAPGGLAAGSSGSGLAAASLSSARPARLSIVAFSLGGVWARAALRAPALAPHLPLLHAYVSIASPHAGFPPDAKGSSLLQTGAFFARAFTKQHNTLALQQLAMQAGAEAAAAAAAVGPRSSSAPHPPSAAATAAAQPLLYYLACGWQQEESSASASASSSEAAAEPLASLLREGLASGPNGQAVFAHCRHVALLASPQDTYSPLHSALACELGSGSASGSSESRHATMVRGLWAGCAGGGAGGAAAAAAAWGGSAARVSVQLREVGGGGAQQAALAEGATGPRDSACAQAPPATLLAALGTGLAGVLDSVSGRDAHMAMLTSEALPLLVALGLAEAWRE